MADPRQGSRHNRGCAVDLSLYDLATGREVEMPSAVRRDDGARLPDYAGGPAERPGAARPLRAAMEAEGFTVYPSEWWHFDYKDWRPVPHPRRAFLRADPRHVPAAFLTHPGRTNEEDTE